RGRELAQRLHKQISALCDVDSTRLEHLARLTNRPVETYTDYREMLATGKVDAVVIATPDHWHAQQIIDACVAGKDVYVEAPICRTPRERQAILEYANRYQRVNQAGSPGFPRILERLKGQSIKSIHAVHGPNPAPPKLAPAMELPAELEWDLWLGPAAWRPYNPAIARFYWRWVMELGGGYIRERGVHLLQLALAHIGPLAGKAHIEATGSFPQPGIFDCPAELETSWRFGGVDVRWKQAQDFNAPGIEVRCATEGDEIPLAWNDAKWITDDDSDDIETDLDLWLEAVAARKVDMPALQAACDAAVLCNLANLAWLCGRPLEWDHDAQAIVNDPQANRAVEPPRRGGWQL
ncbi:MAG: Gfo/Idh/MocA family oxidoreductase, partial [Candidatus Hydrogenedentes bacterium]|nr:Gfo/Idh/MocA family oxidoreductase [Candidatus Hydrogenedentota bacterium]